MPAAGRTITLPGISILRLENGKIAEATAMLRTLFVSVFIPVFTMLARWVIDTHFS